VHVGIGQVVGFVTEKPDPRVATNGKSTYYNLQLADIGWTQRFACSLAVYNSVVVGDKRYQFNGKLNPMKATRAGGTFPDDVQSLVLESVKDHVPAAAAQQQPQQSAASPQPAQR
jgi:hypothetical protein